MSPGPEVQETSSARKFTERHPCVGARLEEAVEAQKGHGWCGALEVVRAKLNDEGVPRNINQATQGAYGGLR